jgi:hypothetical protein
MRVALIFHEHGGNLFTPRQGAMGVPGWSGLRDRPIELAEPRLVQDCLAN